MAECHYIYFWMFKDCVRYYFFFAKKIAVNKLRKMLFISSKNFIFAPEDDPR